MKTKTVQFYADPGHGWAKVSRLDLVKLGILDKISGCSYQKGKWVYLEEDSDLSTYVKALREQGIEPHFKGSTSNRLSRIRNYPGFCVDIIDRACMTVKGPTAKQDDFIRSHFIVATIGGSK